MQRLFFHNQHDHVSHERLSSLESDVNVYDVFGKDKHSLPKDIKLTLLPYLVDKYITLETLAPYIAGVFVLQFSCRDYQGVHLTTENTLFHVAINGQMYSTESINGIIEVELTCPEPVDINIKIEGCEYLPFNTEIEVTAGA